MDAGARLSPERIPPTQSEMVGIGLQKQDLADLKKILIESGTANQKLLALAEHMPQTNVAVVWGGVEVEAQIGNQNESILPPERTVSGLNDLVMLVAVIRKTVKPNVIDQNMLPMNEFVQAVRQLSGREVSEEEIIWWRARTRDELEANGSEAGKIIDATPARGVGSQILVMEDQSNSGNLVLGGEQRSEYYETLETVLNMNGSDFKQQLNYSINKRNGK